MSRLVLLSTIVRAAGLFVIWIVLAGYDTGDLIAGAVAAASAAWVSLHLFAPSAGGLRLSMLVRFALRFLYQSLIAGIDVARRALDPRLPLHCGFVLYPPVLPPGPRRQAFISVMSLLPGTVPAGTGDGGRLLIHCLDVGQPVAAQLAAEEALFARLFGKTDHDD
jgi:multicomponent Na+:H+ antiporter subunit E